MPHGPSGMRLTTRERRLVVVGAAGLLCWSLGAAAAASYQPTPMPWAFTAALGALLVAELAAMPVRSRADRPQLTWAEAALVVGLVLVGPWFIVVAPACVFAAAALVERRLGAAAYSSAVYTVAAAAGYAALTLVDTGPLLALTWRAAAALLLAAATFDAVRSLATWGAGRIQFSALSLLASASLVGGLFLLDLTPAGLASAPAVLVGWMLAHHGWRAVHHEQAMTRRLGTAIRRLGQPGESEVAEAALREARLLFGADAAELQLHASGLRRPRAYLLSRDGEVACRPGSAPAGASPSASTGPVTSVVATLTGAHGDLGTLRLLYDEAIRVSGRDRDTLGSFAHAVAAAALNATLHEDLRTEVAWQLEVVSHDPLTGLANRATLQERIRVALAEPHNLTTALLLVDLDHFKEINDTLGHAAGDSLLERVADRLRALGRRGDLVARLGGDEFAVLLTGLESAADAEPAAEAVLLLLTEPVEHDGLHLSVEGSIGVACYPADAQDPVELLRRAEVAMYQAKSDRGSWVRYDVERDSSSVHRLALVAELRAALDRGEIVAHFQPQADLRTGQVVGVEALARWEHPTRGLLMPADFIGVAEQSGLVRPFTQRMLDLAVAECAGWAAQGRPITVAVNLAARSLLDRQLPHDVAAALARHRLAPELLVLEITESGAASELDVVEDVLARLRRMGVALSVDDFGTGYSSLAFLQRTAVNELKVDRSFVVGMLSSESDLALVRTTVQLAHSIGARAVAEGVEDQAVADALREVGCDLAQGYWLSRPVPPEALRTLLDVATGVDVSPVAVPEPRAESALPIKHAQAVEG